jgi:hypothetical protein
MSPDPRPPAVPDFLSLADRRAAVPAEHSAAVPTGRRGHPSVRSLRRSPAAVKLCFATILLLAGALNCQTPASNGSQAMQLQSESTPKVATLNEVFNLERSLTLRDGGRVTTVLPILTLVRDGSFLVADPREFQIRRYDSLGNLLSFFGRRGTGPGEFSRLIGAVQLADGEIVAAEATGRLAWFNASGEELRSESTGLALVFNVALVDDSTLAIAGRMPGETDGPLIHLWDLKRNRVRTKFFSVPPHDPDLDPAYAFAGAVDIAVRGDTLAATLALSDTVYFFGLDGRELPKMPIPSRHFRPVRRPPPADLQGDPAARTEWSESFSRVSKVFWAPDGSLYVQYFDMRRTEPVWSFVHMRRGNARPVEVRHIPRLLAVSAVDSRLYLIHPQSSEPSVWAIGSRSSGS